MQHTPAFLELTDVDCAGVLARNHVGRLAFRNGPDVDVVPIAYVRDGDWLFMRSAEGAKLDAIAHDPFVAFEVDEIDGPFDWRSVLAHGTIYVLPADGAPIDRDQYLRALEALRTIMPDALTATDPVPERRIVYGLHVDRLDGRMARSGRSASSPRRRRVRAAARLRQPPDGS